MSDTEDPKVNFELPDGWGFYAIEASCDDGSAAWVFHTNFGPLILASSTECAAFAESLWAKARSASGADALDLVAGFRMPADFVGGVA